MSSRLERIVFETTHRCPLDCRFCYAIWKRPGAPAPPPDGYARARRTLRRLFAVADIEHVVFSGGEPFCAPRFAELVIYCRMKGAAVTILTSGAASGPRDYVALAGLGVRHYEITLLAPGAAAHDRLTRTVGSWGRAVDAIRGVRAAGGTVTGGVVVTALNGDLLPGTLRLFAELGVRRVMLNRFNVGGEGIRHEAELQAGAARLRRFFGEADAAVAALGIQATANVCTPVCVLDPGDYPHIRFSSCRPHVTDRAFTLDTAGDLRFCNHSPVAAGNIFERSIGEILDSPYIRRWRTVVPESCAGCADWHRCYGGCRAASEQLGGSIEDADPLCCTLEANEPRRGDGLPGRATAD
ncbi:MAG: radical SAM protein [Candidatus Krumholzibacteriota bacterium]|nr:radical SAM protein [Candidatus Krumholzibacteriota bacterium]